MVSAFILAVALELSAPFGSFKIEVPEFGSRVFPITRYGAKSDGSKCTAALAQAMAACERAGGGTVSVPAGKWLTGAVRFRNNCNLRLEQDAVLEFTDDPMDYPEVHTSWEGLECCNYSPLLYAYGVTNVAITGSGTIAPRMERWRTWFARTPEFRRAYECLNRWCATNAPVTARRILAFDRANFRPQLIQFNRCGNILLDGFKIRESPFWMIHLYHSENCVVRNLDTVAHGSNNDGVDVEMTKNVLIEKCHFDQGDDGIVLKSGRNADGWRLGRCTENVIVRDCDMVNCHSLLGVGSELSGGVRNAWITRSSVKDTYAMLRVKTGPLRGGFVENIHMDHCRGERMIRAFHLHTDYGGRNLKPGEELRTTKIRNLRFKDCSARLAAYGIQLKGDSRCPPSDIEVDNIRIGRVVHSFTDISDCEDVRLSHLSLAPKGTVDYTPDTFVAEGPDADEYLANGSWRKIIVKVRPGDRVILRFPPSPARDRMAAHALDQGGVVIHEPFEFVPSLAPARAAAGKPDNPKRTVVEVQYPERMVTNAAGGIVADFGKDAFGWIEIDAPAAGLDYFLNIGEVFWTNCNEVARKHGQHVRARGVKWHTEQAGFQRVPVAPDLRNLFAAGEGSPVKLPPEYGIVTPFRAVEFYQADFPVSERMIRRHVISYSADRNESAFACDCEKLVTVYDFCKYTMFATSFAGMPVDGDRERIPYEADTYAAQLNWYAVSSDYAYPRAAIEYLYDHPTWPTEFKQASVLSAWTDWMWSGDTSSIAKHYETLKKEKMLLAHVRNSDGLLVSGGERQPWPSYTNHCGLADIVDWPKTERADFDFRDVNAVVNAFHFRTLEAMRDLADALGKHDEAADFTARAQRLRRAYAQVLIDPTTGLVLDGEGSTHSSVQANAIALAFGLVPAERTDQVADWLEKQGMGCSVYFAQYLLEALFRAGRVKAAFALLTAENRRSWLGMLEQGATMTMESWNPQLKPNLDYNHAWGATAINVISRFILGVTPLKPGFERISIKPNFGPLRRVSATVPTRAGPVRIEYRDGQLSVATPAPTMVEWRGATYQLSGTGKFEKVR